MVSVFKISIFLEQKKDLKIFKHKKTFGVFCYLTIKKQIWIKYIFKIYVKREHCEDLLCTKRYANNFDSEKKLLGECSPEITCYAVL